MSTLKEWLLGAGIYPSSLCAAYEFALLPEGVERHAMRRSCEKWVHYNGLDLIREVRTKNTRKRTNKIHID